MACFFPHCSAKQFRDCTGCWGYSVEQVAEYRRLLTQALDYSQRFGDNTADEIVWRVDAFKALNPGP